MVDYEELQDDPGFDPDDFEWPYEYTQDGTTIYATEKLDEAEAGAYIVKGRGYYQRELTIFAVVDGDEIELHYKIGPMKFDRIRRITGYLVGTLDRFNDGKRAEESERVKHKVGR